tara:strand:- start:10812 stop:11519 length:708 start_codon:yes stop_codon:yes gene_type:complete
MATYNGAEFLKEQLDSILKQLSANDELIISDDGSTDATVKIIEAYQDDRIHLFHANYGNLIYNFENALKQAKGDLIFLSDQDDIWVADKVEKSVQHLKKYALVFSNANMFYDDNTSESKLFFEDSKRKTGTLNNLVKVKFLGATLAFRRSVLERALPFPKHIPMHDVWLGLIAETTASTMYIEEPLIYYRRHGNAASSTGGKSKNSLYSKLKMRGYLVIYLCKRVLFRNSKTTRF